MHTVFALGFDSMPSIAGFDSNSNFSLLVTTASECDSALAAAPVAAVFDRDSVHGASLDCNSDFRPFQSFPEHLHTIVIEKPTDFSNIREPCSIFLNTTNLTRS